ncbi:MAG TPA: ATP-binding protein [Candidatus Aminicenantes bacterium]|nr:ATP-binding protein [Candidatus Aminicenantes bacterium]
MPAEPTVAVASGKGGTGKTTVAVNLALALSAGRPIQFLDCDVEGPNSRFFLKPRIEASEEVAILVPEIDDSRCDRCGICARVCAYNALAVVPQAVLVFSELCHGCGACALLCPRRAIREVPKRIGVVESGRAGAIRFLQGRLDVGQAISPPLIKAVKEKRDPDLTAVIDAPPGTSCPAVESMRGSDFALLVTEPTPFGLHDLELAAGAAEALGLPRGILINRADGGDGDARIRAFAAGENVPVLAAIPFDRRIAEAYSRGDTLLGLDPGWSAKFQALYEAIRAEIP